MRTEELLGDCLRQLSRPDQVGPAPDIRVVSSTPCHLIKRVQEFLCCASKGMCRNVGIGLCRPVRRVLGIGLSCCETRRNIGLVESGSSGRIWRGQSLRTSFQIGDVRLHKSEVESPRASCYPIHDRLEWTIPQPLRCVFGEGVTRLQTILVYRMLEQSGLRVIDDRVDIRLQDFSVVDIRRVAQCLQERGMVGVRMVKAKRG